ncbi:uncharacterized protein [Amphiura filiformis]|uniref:uncharacterized protein n=1 Tax=Amphiura filiformis TaxID=82378 RepID=UPI003B21C4E6
MAGAAGFSEPSCSSSFSNSSSSGVDKDSFGMVTLTSQSSTATSDDGNTMATAQTSSTAKSDESDVPNSSRTFRRQSSSSSISSTDSCLSEAKYAEIHKHEFDFVLWFTTKNIQEADEIFQVLEKEQRLRGFRYDRDQTIGRVHVLNIAEAIEKSWKILLLFSPEAVEDNWFMNEMYTSLTHDINLSKGNVVPILLRKRRKSLPSYLSSIFFINISYAHIR